MVGCFIAEYIYVSIYQKVGIHLLPWKDDTWGQCEKVARKNINSDKLSRTLSFPIQNAMQKKAKEWFPLNNMSLFEKCPKNKTSLAGQIIIWLCFWFCIWFDICQTQPKWHQILGRQCCYEERLTHIQSSIPGSHGPNYPSSMIQYTGCFFNWYP